jgi:hypothetical protein
MDLSNSLDNVICGYLWAYIIPAAHSWRIENIHSLELNRRIVHILCQTSSWQFRAYHNP